MCCTGISDSGCSAANTRTVTCPLMFFTAGFWYVPLYNALICCLFPLLSLITRAPFSLVCFERRLLQGKEGPKIPLSDVITILPPKEEIALEATPNFG